MKQYQLKVNEEWVKAIIPVGNDMYYFTENGIYTAEGKRVKRAAWDWLLSPLRKLKWAIQDFIYGS